MSIHSSHPPASPRRDELDARVAAELRALGEPELDSDELAASPTSFVPDGPVPYRTATDGAVLAAFALAYPADGDLARPLPSDEDALGELAQHRVWRKVAARVRTPSAPAAPRRVRATWVAVATAAGIALVPMLGARIGGAPQAGGDRAVIEALAEQAKGTLDALPGAQDGARAREYADRYAAQLSGRAPGGEGDVR